MRAARSRSALVAALVGLGAAGAAHASDEAFFRSCEVARRAALTAPDVRALGALMVDGAQYVHSNGEIDDRASLAQRLASGALVYRTIVVDEERYDCHASGCEVSGAQTLGVRANGRDLSVRNRFRASWLRVGDACKLAGYRSAPLDPAPPAAN